LLRAATSCFTTFSKPSGSVDENVFAYSNRNGDERALVIYNNRFSTAHGTIDFSAAYADKSNSQLRQQRLREGLDLSRDPGIILAWRDSLTGLEYLRRASVLADRGLTLDLHAYQSHVFLGWRELRSTAEQPWDRLCDQLNGHGVPNLDDALVLMELKPVHDALDALLYPELVRQLADFSAQPPLTVAADRKTERERGDFVKQASTRFEALYQAAREAPPSLIGNLKAEDPVASLRSCCIPRLSALCYAPFSGGSIVPGAVACTTARHVLPSPSPRDIAIALWGPVFGWCVIDCLASTIDPENSSSRGARTF
jgi:hypothetical protein